MTNPWAKSVTYREALDGLIERFAQLKQQDRIANSEMMPNIESINGYWFSSST